MTKLSPDGVSGDRLKVNVRVSRLAAIALTWLLLCDPGRAADSAPAGEVPPALPVAATDGLWPVYENTLKHAKYIDLTHAVAPSIPVWQGFGRSSFGPALNPETGAPYRYATDGFEATRYELATDQLGTQLDPPAHWAPEYPAIDELPATYAARPLVVIPIVEQVAREPGYHLQVADIERWEARHGRIPQGSVVMVRSDLSRDWPDPALATRTVFPGVSVGQVPEAPLPRSDKLLRWDPKQGVRVRK